MTPREVILLVEARGQSLSLCDEANVNLLQAAVLARRHIAAGSRVRIRLMVDLGQSIEEYSLLHHLHPHGLEAWRARFTEERARLGVAEARRSLVRAARAQRGIVRFRMHARGQELGIDDTLFYSPMFAVVDGANEAVFDGLERDPSPQLKRARLAEFRACVEAFRGRSYLDLEVEIARQCLARELGTMMDAVDLAVVLPVTPEPADWFADPLVWDTVSALLDAHAGGEGNADFAARAVGLYPLLREHADGPGYFNSPTRANYQHRKLRVSAVDRFKLLDLNAAYRLSFTAMREALAAQRAGRAGLLVGLKYPYLAAVMAALVAREAAQCLADGPVEVIQVEGISGAINPMTGGLLRQHLVERLPTDAGFRVLFGPATIWDEMPRRPGPLPLIHDHLRQLLAASPQSPERGDLLPA